MFQILVNGIAFESCSTFLCFWVVRTRGGKKKAQFDPRTVLKLWLAFVCILYFSSNSLLHNFNYSVYKVVEKEANYLAIYILELYISYTFDNIITCCFE